MAKAKGAPNKPPIGRVSLEGLNIISERATQAEKLGLANFYGVPTRRAYFLALAVLTLFFGEDWVARHILADRRTHKRGRGFLKQPSVVTNDAAALKHSLRVSVLAEMLFNLQDVQGFDFCAERLRDGQVESSFAELEIARMLEMRHIPFVFSDPYDLEIFLPGGPAVCAEVKSKAEATAVSAESLRNSLRDACKQLPKGRPGVIFVKTPHHWLEDGVRLPDALIPEIDEKFRNHTRLISIKFYASDFREHGDVFAEDMGHFEITSPHNPLGHVRNWNLFDDPTPTVPGQPWNGFPPHWERLFHRDGEPIDQG